MAISDHRLYRGLTFTIFAAVAVVAVGLLARPPDLHAGISPGSATAGLASTPPGLQTNRTEIKEFTRFLEGWTSTPQIAGVINDR
jgi:hypothetical protein